MNKPSKLSRGTEIVTDTCVANAGGRFDLVLIAAVRAREIARKQKYDNEQTYVNPCVSALLEVQSKSIGREYLKKV
jgi:DNA-directed RNA polymerase subunit K/omega